MAIALRRQGVPVGEGADDGGVEMGGAVRCTPHIAQQQAAALRVAVQPAVAGGVDARRTLKPVHAQAGVVRDGGQAAGLHDGLCLQPGVLGKGGACLLHVDIHAHVGGHDHLHAQLAQNGLHLRQLALVM